MRNKKFIFSMGLAALLFAACSNDDDLATGAGGSGVPSVVEGEPTYAFFTVKSGEAKNSRAAEAPETGDDQIAGDVTLLVFNYQTKVLEDKFTITDQSGVGYNGTFLMTSGKKSIYAFANLTAASGQTQINGLTPKVSTVDDLLSLTTGEAGTSLGQTNVNVPMSNINDGLAKDVANGIEQGNAAADNHIELTLLRMLSRAKLVLKAGVTNFTVSGFTANNIAKSTYLVQRALGGVVKSPLYEKNWGAGITAADFMAKETFYTGATPNTVNQLNKLYYLTENTSPSFLKGAATHFIVKGIYVPGRIIRSEIFDVATQTLKPNYGATPTQADCAAYCYVTASPNVAVIPTGEFFLNKTVLNAAIALYNGNVGADKQLDPAAVKYVEYTKGSYYRINLGEGDSGSTVFGVKRNNSYTVTINSVSGPGFSTPDGSDGAEGDPTTPIDQKTYLDVTVQVAPWTEVSQGADIN